VAPTARRARFPRHLPPRRSHGDLVDFWRTLEAHYREGLFPERFGYALDLSRIERADPRGPLLMAEHIRAERDFYRTHCVGLAVVVGSPMTQRLVNTVARLVREKPCSMISVSSVPEATSWLELAWRSSDAGFPAP